MESDKLIKFENRQKVAELIVRVLIEKITVSEALSLFPKEKNDINIKCAFDALMHREADEDIRAKDKEYAEVQDEFLFFLSETLKNDEELPQNIVSKYYEYHADNLIGEWDKPLKSILKNIKRIINF